MNPKVYIVILNWNDGDVTLSCLESIRELNYKNYRVVVVDNGSTDGSPDRIEELFPDVPLIRNKNNVGFDEGNNIGIRKALAEGADAVLLLNNDTVVDPDLLRALTDAASSLPEAGVLGPKIYYFEDPKRIWWIGCRKSHSRTGWLLNYTQEGKGQLDQGQHDDARRIDGVVGCAMYVKREVLEAVGLLDARFFIYHEEHDFCWRAQRAGWRCYFVPGAKVWHKVAVSMGGEDSPSRNYLWTRNWLLLSRRQTRFLFWPAVYLAYLREGYWLYQGFIERGKGETAEAVLAAVWNAVLGRYGPIRDLKPPRWLSRLAKWDYSRRVLHGSV